jgi:acyl-CoA reductase-like NAD-dependent aldehyde dehydrogenase
MLKIINPATEQVIAELPSSSASEVEAAYLQARQAAAGWAAIPYAERARIVGNFRRNLAEAHSQAAQTLTSEMGKPLVQAEREIQGALDRIDWFLAETPRHLGREIVRVNPPMSEELHYEPLGVVGTISAWNYPYLVGINVMIPALLTGNALLYKASEFVSLTGRLIGELWQASGLPQGVFTALCGDGRVGECLVAQPLDGFFFTGSYATGKKIAESLAGRFIPSGFELGGKDASYVRRDASVAAAAAALADGAFYNAGQSCCAVERIYVEASIYEEFVEHFVRETKTLPLGDPLDPQTSFGPLTREAQRAVLEGQVADALSKGAREVLPGGRQAGKGYFYRPVVLADTSAAMTIMREESFGPVIGIQKVSGDEEAISLINDSPYGLTSGIYGGSEEQARNIGRRLNTTGLISGTFVNGLRTAGQRG